MVMEAATLGGGRFWLTEAVFQHIRGVRSTQVGYAGGSEAFPYFEIVCTGQTGHAEVVSLTFDSDVVSYASLLEVFFKIHDAALDEHYSATGLSPHRSIIFFHSTEQKRTAQLVLKRMQRSTQQSLTTELLAFGAFHTAEDEHQNFYKNNRTSPFCAEIIAPKIAEARSIFKKPYSTFAA